MIDYVKGVLASQTVAALRMVKDCIAACPADRWGEPVGTIAFGGVVYHVLFFADLYLSTSEQAFTLTDVHRAGGDPRQIGFKAALPPTRSLEYADAVIRKSTEVIASETATSMQAHCGFSWLQITRGELHVYNTRHIQHHVGAMGASLRRQGIGTIGPDPMDWVDHSRFPDLPALMPVTPAPITPAPVKPA